ncbi:MAG: AMP-dependent synthetase [Gammaproteobacteria bacterium]|nr:MAG: AMP-dependent synthetase [Gammaproteobacteria bacterium]
MMSPLSRLFTDGNAARIIAIDDGRAITLGEWRTHVQGLVNTLQSQPAQTFLLVHTNTLRFATGLFALLHAGKDVVLPPNAQAGTLADMQAYADALLGEGDCALPTWRIEAGKDHGTALQPFDMDARHITVLTSGSTGEPKRISKPVRCFDAEIQALEALWGARLGDATILSTVSHQHIYGLLFRLLWPLASGRVFDTAMHAFPEALYAAMQQHARVAVVSSPSQLRRFPQTLDLSAVSPHVTAVFSSGGPLPREAALDWEARLGQSPMEVLGSSETGGVAWRQQTHADAQTPWCAFDAVVTSEVDGCLAVQSPFTGLPHPFVMGDRIQQLDTRHFHVLGRADTIVKIEEKRVSLTAMESALRHHPSVSDARVVPLPDNAHRLGAVIVLREPAGEFAATDRRRTSEQLRDHLLAHFERVVLPRKWRFVTALPMNSQGKTTLADVQALFSDHRTNILLSETATTRVLSIMPGDQDFAGHFPALPILAGVLQFDWAVRACEGWYPPQAFRGIRKLKFSEPVMPGQRLQLELEKQGDGCVQFRYQCESRPMSSGIIVFAGDA